MSGVGKNVALCFGIPHQVLAHNPLLAEYLHRIQKVSSLVLHKVDLSETAAAQYFKREKMSGPDFFIFEVLYLALL
jgi:hypothetical protein